MSDRLRFLRWSVWLAIGLFFSGAGLWIGFAKHDWVGAAPNFLWAALFLALFVSALRRSRKHAQELARVQRDLNVR
jgi:hypothetical protein